MKNRNRDYLHGGEGFAIASISIVTCIVIVAGAVWGSYMSTQKAYDALAASGSKLAGVQNVGQGGIEKVSGYLREASGVQEVPVAVTTTPDKPEEPVIPSVSPSVKPSKSPEPSKPEDINVAVSCVSVDRDLKVKFTDADRNESITGYAFEIVLKDKNNVEKTYTDSDQDGIIHITDLAGGEYSLLIKSLYGFTFPETAQRVTVKEHIEYVVINVLDEVKSYDQVKPEEEDAMATNSQEVIEVESQVQDTVEWVSSTAKTIYKEIEYSTITKPVKRTALSGTLPDRDPSPDPSTEPSGDPTTPPPEEPSVEPSVEPSEEPSTPPSEDPSPDPSTDPSTEPSVEPSGEPSPSPSAVPIVYPTAIPATAISFDRAELTLLPESTEESQKKATVTASVAAYLDADTLAHTQESIFVYEWSLAPNDYVSIDGATNKNSVKLVATGHPTEKQELALKLKVTQELTQTDLPEGEPQNKATISGEKTFTVAVAPKLITALKVQTSASDASTSREMTLTSPAGTFTPVVYATYADGTSELLENNKVTWSVDKEKIATVSSDGVITALYDGTAVIKATFKVSEQKNVSAEYKVTIPYNPAFDEESLLLDTKERQIYIKDPKDTSGKTFKKAVFADYFKAGTKFFIKEQQYTGWQTLEDNNTYYFDKDGKAVTGQQVIEGVTYNFTKDGWLQMDSKTIGIDVSFWQGAINWEQVKNSGVNYAMVRVGYRGYGAEGTLVEDAWFGQNVYYAAQNNIKVGLYFFSQAVTEAEAIEEASMVVNLLEKYGLGKYITYPIFFDSEYGNNKHTGRADNIDAIQRTACAKAFCETIKNAGYTPGIYASKNWFTGKLDMNTLNSYVVWLAQYATKPDYSGRYDIWQYSSKGTVGGISGNVDMNISYLNY